MPLSIDANPAGADPLDRRPDPKPMIILQAMFSRGLGGLERAFLDHAILLNARGHVVHCLIATNAKSRGELERLAAECGDRLLVHPLPTQGWARLLLRLRLSQLLRRLRPDVIVAHGAKSVSRFVPLRPRGIPLFAITHNASPRLMGGTHLLALTGEMERLFVSRGYPAQHIFRVPNVLPARFADLAQHPDRPLHAPLSIGVLARLVHKKGYRHLPARPTAGARPWPAGQGGDRRRRRGARSTAATL